MFNSFKSYIFLNCRNATLGMTMLFFTATSDPRFSIMLPKYVIVCTFSRVSPSIVIGSFSFVFYFRILLLLLCLWRSGCVHPYLLVCMCRRAWSSARSILSSCILAVHHILWHWSSLGMHPWTVLHSRLYSVVHHINSLWCWRFQVLHNVKEGSVRFYLLCQMLSHSRGN